MHDLHGEQLRPARTLRENHWRSLTSALVPHYLEVNDKAAAAFGIDHRHPYFDLRLIEFCYGIPANQKLSQGWDRAIQRRAMEGILPKQIQWRTQKSDWGEQFKHGFLKLDKERLNSILRSDMSELGNYVDIDVLKATHRRATQGQVNEDDGMNLWLAITLGIWLQQRPT
jgi:asparagine synthase (glutamine-hydrolysing)